MSLNLVIDLAIVSLVSNLRNVALLKKEIRQQIRINRFESLIYTTWYFNYNLLNYFFCESIWSY